MSATNATTYYELPVFIATDKPAWLTDWNGAMNAIDTAIKEALTAGENAQTTANTATSSIATINDSLTTINTSLTTLTSTVTSLTGSVNTINSLIGNGEPTTSDKTLIGAINEIYAMIGGGTEVDADIVAYDNTSSGLTATNVQDAIDELHDADGIAYDNTTSGLTATDVQSAIDEIAQGGGSGGGFDLTAYTGTGTVTVSVGTDAGSDMSYGMNSAKNILQISGQIFSVSNASGLAQGDNTVANIAISDLPTIATPYEIHVGGVVTLKSDGTPSSFYPLYLKFKSDNSIDLVLRVPSANAQAATLEINLPAVILFIKNA